MLDAITIYQLIVYVVGFIVVSVPVGIVVYDWYENRGSTKDEQTQTINEQEVKENPKRKDRRKFYSSSMDDPKV